MCIRLLCVAALVLAAFTITSTTTASAHVASCDRSPHYSICAIHHWRDVTWYEQDLLVVPRSHYRATAERSHSAAYRHWVRHLWYRRASAWHRHLVPYSPAWRADILCVHGREGSWTDPNAPYWGGLQMDGSFMATYGPRFLARWGTADNWPPVDQMLAAWRAYASGRGFAPWPNTAAACGLL
jgi:hypothetical protein